MKKGPTRSAEDRRGVPGWRFVTWLVLLTFTLQSFATQTHIHWPPPASNRTSVAKVLEGPNFQNKSPFDKDTTCPFCQAIIHAGAFFASAAPPLLLPNLWAEWATPQPVATVARVSAAHSWRSRAPPQH